MSAPTMPGQLTVYRTRVTERAALVGVVLTGMIVRLVVTAGHSTPRLFPDEYIYASLARSISHGSLTIRGGAAGFPAIVQPLLAAPFWLADDPALAYGLTKTLHATLMPLAAIPVWIIARRLGLPQWQRLACATMTVVLPNVVYAGYVTADAVAYPIALAAIAAGLTVLERPTKRGEVVFLGFAGLAAATRVQYIVILAAFAVTAAITNRGRPAVVIRRFPLAAVCATAGLALIVAAGPSDLLGYYDGVLALEIGWNAAQWALTDMFLAAFACGWVLVPAAGVGFVAALFRPRARIERTFALFVGSVACLLLAEAAIYAANGSERFQERYLIAVLPLVMPLAFLGFRRSGRLATLAGATGAMLLLALSARYPLSTYTAGFGKQDSPFLQAVSALEDAMGVGPAGLAVALVAGLLAVVAVVATRVRSLAGVVAAAAVTVSIAATVGALSFDRAASNRVWESLGGDPAWIDRATSGSADLVVTPRASRSDIQSHLIWNSSLARVTRLPGADPIDDFNQSRVLIAPDGALSTTRGPLARQFVIAESGSRLELTGVRLVARGTLGRMWQREGVPRAAMLVDGLARDNTLDATTSVTVWRQSAPQSLRLAIEPIDGTPSSLTITAQARTRHLAITPQSLTWVDIRVPAGRGPWVVLIESPARVIDAGRLVGARVRALQLRANAG